MDLIRPTQPTDEPSSWKPLHGLVLLVFVCVYAAVFSHFTVGRHLELNTYAYDLGTVDQGVWLAGHSTEPFVTVRGLHLLGDHVRLISYLLAPLYYIWDDVRALIIAQTLAIALGGVFIALLARRVAPSSPWIGLVMALSYLLSPAVQNLNIDHVHPDAFAQTFILGSVLALQSDRLAWFWTAMALALSCKEDVPLVYVALGFLVVLRGRWRLGMAIGAVGGLYFLLATRVILPYFNEVGFFRSDYTRGFRNSMHDPRWLFERFLGPDSRAYLLALGAPVAFLCFRKPILLIPAIPALAANFLSGHTPMRNIIYHYHTSIVPFLYIAAVATLASWRYKKTVCVAALGLVVAGSVYANIRFGQLPVNKLYRIQMPIRRSFSDPGVLAAKRVMTQIPSDAGVAADYSLVPQLAHRKHIYQFPNPFMPFYWGIKGSSPHPTGNVEYIILRTGYVRDERHQQLLRELLDSGSFRTVVDDEFVQLYKRSDHVVPNEP